MTKLTEIFEKCCSIYLQNMH